MDARTELVGLKPKNKEMVFDLVRELGFDVSDWIATARNPAKIRANPKYCYDWSFVEPGKIAIFNLWHDVMGVEDNKIVYRANFRQNAEFHRLNGGKQQWITRGLKLDRDAADAARDDLPVRVIVVDGKRRATEDANSESSQVSGRQLDASPWHVQLYDASTGDFVLARGTAQSNFVDQFDELEIEAHVSRKSGRNFKFSRNPVVRRSVLTRSAGRCEYCNSYGFKTISGPLYLETHHIIPLSEGGADATSNVIAICPNDHRKAHFADDAPTMRNTMLALVAQKILR